MVVTFKIVRFFSRLGIEKPEEEDSPRCGLLLCIWFLWKRTERALNLSAGRWAFSSCAGEFGCFSPKTSVPSCSLFVLSCPLGAVSSLSFAPSLTVLVSVGSGHLQAASHITNTIGASLIKEVKGQSTSNQTASVLCLLHSWHWGAKEERKEEKDVIQTSRNEGKKEMMREKQKKGSKVEKEGKDKD